MALRHRAKKRYGCMDPLIAKSRLIRAGYRVDNISSDEFIVDLYSRLIMIQW